MTAGFLRGLGLTEYESRAFLALLEQGPLTASLLAVKAKVPQPKIYSVLDSLAEKKLVVLLREKPKTFQAIEIEPALSAFIESRKKRLDELKARAIKTLKERKKETLVEKERIVSISLGEEQRLRNVPLPEDLAGKEFLFMIEPPKLTKEIIQSLKKALKRGVKIQGILTEPEKNKESTKVLRKFGIPLRVEESFKGFAFWVYDEKACRIIVLDPKTGESISIDVASQALSRALTQFFWQVWSKAKAL